MGNWGGGQGRSKGKGKYTNTRDFLSWLRTWYSVLHLLMALMPNHDNMKTMAVLKVAVQSYSLCIVHTSDGLELTMLRKDLIASR